MKAIKRFLKNKKGDMISFNVVFHILEIIFTIMMGISVFFIISIEREIDTFPIESEILFDRMLYSNNGLWFYDEEIDRLYPGILNLKNFNDTKKIEKLLDQSIYYGTENKRAAAELVLEEDNGEKYAPIYYNGQKYNEWIEWYKAGVIKGAGARQGKTKTFNILIKNEEELIPATLTITVLIPNI